ncbi:hypothetical protein [Flavobacterium sp.]|uniref:hypothetical protein n=1 Tax=Flavobacterium sp. TaxID=239 RepID=UPI0037B26593
MKKFIQNIIHFALIGLIPLFFLFLIYLFTDPFKVVKTYDTFYDNSKNERVGLNKDYVSTTTFINNCNKKKQNYNSFIFGNSRSILYQISDWKKHLQKNSQCFHFDASNESLLALNKKMEFIDKNGYKINNVLLVLDKSILIQDTPKTGHLFVISPILVNNSNIYYFHLSFIKAFLSFKFLYSYADFRLSGHIKPYMKANFLLDDKPLKYDVITNEVRQDFFEKCIQENRYYTPERMLSFYKRGKIQKQSTISIKESQKNILKNIRKIAIMQHANIKIVISPLYDQLKLNSNDLNYLKALFGNNNVFDYSGINYITNDYRNYYENSHYRPHIARAIMDNIYSK